MLYVLIQNAHTRAFIIKVYLCPSLAFVYVEVLTVEFQFSELNVSEAMGTVEVTVMANGTSEFDYTVNLTASDITTGEIIPLCICSM